VEDPENVSADELLAAKDSAIAASSNITFIALTATPKAKTLRLFGTQDEDGNWRAFDTYTMAQAIEEGFILDVLTNYSTYDMFLRVKNELDNSEQETLVDTAHAVTAIVQFARLHPTAIAQKVRVVVEHFQRNVKPLLTGNARAMVVTSSRREAYRWFEAMNSYIDKQGYDDIRPLVAFSGSLESDDGETVTEASLNEAGITVEADETADADDGSPDEGHDDRLVRQLLRGTVKTGDFRAGGQTLALNLVGACRQIRPREEGVAALVGIERITLVIGVNERTRGGAPVTDHHRITALIRHSDARAVPQRSTVRQVLHARRQTNSHRREERDGRDQDHHHNAENEGNDARRATGHRRHDHRSRGDISAACIALRTSTRVALRDSTRVFTILRPGRVLAARRTVGGM